MLELEQEGPILLALLLAHPWTPGIEVWGFARQAPFAKDGAQLIDLLTIAETKMAIVIHSDLSSWKTVDLS